MKFVFKTRVGFDLPLNDLAARFDAVFISIGTWKESWLYLPGTELKNVHPALPFLEAVARREKVSIGSRVAIIGGGNAAIDSARTVAAHGRAGHHPLSPRAQRYARHRRGDSGRRGRRRALCLSRRAAPHPGRTPTAA